MRNKQITGFRNLKVSNLLSVSETTIGGSTSKSVELTAGANDASINVEVGAGKDLIDFTNVTYSNGSTQYELLEGIIINASSDTPTLAVYNGYSNLDIIDLAMGSKVGNNIPIEVTGKNFSAGVSATVYESGVRIDVDGYPTIEIRDVVGYPTKFAISGYAVSDNFVFTDLSDDSVIVIFDGVGVQTVRVRFTLNIVKNSVHDFGKWFFDVGEYERTDNARIVFSSVNEIIKDPEGAAISTSLTDFLTEILTYTEISDPVVFENLTFGTTIPPTTYTNTLLYNVV